MSSQILGRGAPEGRLGLRRRVLVAQVPRLDPSQQAVVEHRGGPLRVLGAPGCGKTTTLVEAVVARIERERLDAGEVLVLAPTRTAAARLRERLTARLARTVREPLARTPASFAFGVLRQVSALAGAPSPRLISGPEQDLVLRELLAGHLAGEGAAPRWPPDLQVALGTRGFRAELRDLLMRAVERGLDDDDLARLGREHARPEWVAASQVLEEYLGVTSLATPGAYDPASIAGTAAGELLADPGLLARVQASARFIAVDDAHELTPAMAHLVRLVAGRGGPLLLTGDPDAVTQGFRGADPGLLVGPVDDLAVPGGQVATLRLAHSWRQGATLRAVTRRVADRIGAAGGVAHRDVGDAGTGAIGEAGTGGQAQVHILSSPVHEAAFVADLLRRQHLENDVAWADMAVLVRGSARAVTLRRVLAGADVPVEVPVTEQPLAHRTAVVPLLDAFEVALRLAEGAAQPLDPERSVDLLTSPLGGADAVALRRLRRALRAQEAGGGGGRSSDELLVAAVLDPALVSGIDAGTAAPVHRVARVLAAATAAFTPTGADQGRQPNAETVLWAIWSATHLAEAWRRTALAGGPSGARADRDLDAVVALFDAAARFVDRLPHAAPVAFLEHVRGQEVPGDSIAERADGADAVSLLTPAGAAGLGWRVVVVAGVQEGIWPDLRLRGSLLGSQDLVDLMRGHLGSTPAAVRAVRDDETRLFHVAVSRASELLVVTAVRNEDEQPSDLLDLVDPPPQLPAGATERHDQQPSGWDAQGQRALTSVPAPLSLPSLVAQLRQAVTHPGADDDPQQSARARAAAAQLARLAAAGVPGADPRDWHGLAPLSDDGPLQLAGPVPVSPSRVEEFERCSLRWLLTSAGGRSASSLAQGMGNLVHEIAADLPDADAATLTAELHRRWGRLGLGTGWAADTERARLERMIAKLGAYLAAQRGEWELVDVEVPFAVQVPLPQGPAVLTGRVDRLERDAAGRLRVVDLKTVKTAPANGDIGEHAQLGIYQLAVQHGAFSSGELAASAGAALVHLGTGAVQAKQQQQPPLADAEDPDWAMQLLARAATGMNGATFDATVNELCGRCSLRACCPATAEGRPVTR